jgi:hypothetical protein
MIWVLVFCTSIHGGAVCIEPQKFNTATACVATAREMKKAALRAHRFSSPSFKCVGVKKIA